MAVLDQYSTLDEIQGEYADAASYAEDDSVAKCRRFITACRLLILKLPKSSGHGSATLSLNPDLIQQEKRQAEKWVSSRSGANAGVKHLDVRGFRR